MNEKINEITTAENLYRNGQKGQAIVTQQYQDFESIKLLDEVQQKKKETTENQHQSETGLNQTTNNHTILEGIDIMKHTQHREIKKSERNVEDPNYQYIITVRGTKEEVENCKFKAKVAFKDGKYDKAENLLLKAKRILPTENVEDLLKQVREAKELKQNSDRTEQVTEIVNIANTVKVEETTSEDNSLNAVKCLRGFGEAFTAGNFVKAERLLNKAKRLDPSLDVDQKLSQVEAAKYNNIIKEKRKEKIEKAKREYKIAGESMTAYNAGDLLKAEQILLQAMIFDPTLNLDFELWIIRTNMALKGSEESKDIDETGPEETISESDMKYVAEYFYKAKKAYNASDFRNASKCIKEAITFDPSLDSKCIAATASKNLTEGKPIISDDACSLSTERNQRDEIQKLDKEYSKMGKKIFCFCINLFVIITGYFLYYYYIDVAN